MGLSNLLGLIAQNAVAPDTADPNTIDVLGSIPHPGRTPGIAPPVVPGNPSVSTPRMLTQEQLNSLKAPGNLPEHKGMFGVKGTLRDLLGMVGDAFLAQSGGKPVYAPVRQQEKLSDSMAGFVQDPVKAISAMSQVDPEAAFKLYQEWQANNYKNDMVDLRKNANTVDSNTADDKRYDQYSKLFSQYMGAATPDTYERIKPLLETFKQRGGLGEDFEIPDAFDPSLSRTYQYGGMPSTNQVTTTQRDRQLNISQQNADANTTRANRPPASRPHTVTEAEEISRIRSAVNRGQPLSKGDQETWTRYTQGTGGRRRGAAPPPPSNPRGIRVIRPN